MCVSLDVRLSPSASPSAKVGLCSGTKKVVEGSVHLVMHTRHVAMAESLVGTNQALCPSKNSPCTCVRAKKKTRKQLVRDASGFKEEGGVSTLFFFRSSWGSSGWSSSLVTTAFTTTTAATTGAARFLGSFLVHFVVVNELNHGRFSSVT